MTRNISGTCPICQKEGNLIADEEIVKCKNCGYIISVSEKWKYE